MVDGEAGPGREGHGGTGGQREKRESWAAWMGVLAAFKEALEETIDELRERGDLSPERAKEAVRSTMRRAQSAVGQAKERLDMVPRREFDALRAEVEDLARRVRILEGGGPRQIPIDSE